MSQLQIHDHTFEPFLSESEIQRRVGELAQVLDQRYEGKNPLLLVVLNGAFIVASDLVREMTCGPEIQFIRISTYGNTMHSSQAAQLLLRLEIEVENRDLIIVEDIVDTGKTTDFFIDHLRQQHPQSVSLVTLLFKPANFVHQYRPDYVGFEIPSDFVVGYGMDYAQKGRELKAIYRVADPKKID